MKDQLADALLASDTFDPPALRVGVVSDNSPLEVDLAGGTGLTASYVQPYTSAPGTASIGDNVLILQTKTDLIILGQIIAVG